MDKVHVLSSPTKVLAFFCIVNVLIYFDRGAIASNGVNNAVVENFSLTLYQVCADRVLRKGSL